MQKICNYGSHVFIDLVLNFGNWIKMKLAKPKKMEMKQFSIHCLCFSVPIQAKTKKLKKIPLCQHFGLKGPKNEFFKKFISFARNGQF